LKLACRPAYGSRGQPIVLRSNYFEITPNKGILLYRYNVAVELHKEKGKEKPIRRRTRRRLMELLLEKQTFKAHAASVASDYASTVISAVKLNLGDEDEKTAPVTYFEKEETELRDPPLVYRITVSGTGVIPLNDLMAYLNSVEAMPTYLQGEAKEREAKGKGDAIQALNIIMSKHAEETPNVVSFGQNKFYAIGESNSMSDLGGALVAIRGYYCSVRTSTKRLLVNVNVCTSPFYQSGPLLEFMSSYMNSRPPPTLHQLDRFLKGLKVETNYLKNKKGGPQLKVKTIWGLGRKPKFAQNASEHKFDTGDGVEVTVEKFFRDSMYFQYIREHSTNSQAGHNIRLRDPRAYLVNVGSLEKQVLIPPEVCIVRPGQRHVGALTPSQTSNMIKVACRPPGENAHHIVNRGAPLIGFTGVENDPLKRLFGLQITPEMITVPARILNIPPLSYLNGTVQPSRGSWNMVNKKFSVPMAVKNWSYLIVSGRYTDVGHLTNTVRKFKNALDRVGMQAENPKPSNGFVVQLEEKQGQGDLRTFETILGENFKALEAKFADAQRNGVKIMLVILPTESADIYARLKFFGDIKFGIHTVCCQASKITKEGRGQDQYMANVALKFNLKLGGVNQSLQPNQMGVLADNKTMVLGIDVTHPSPGSQEGAPSVAGVVSNLNGRCGQWPASLTIQESRVEMVTTLSNMVVERLQLWKKKNSSLPERILVYRDGVSEGQYDLVLKNEYPAILDACKKMNFLARPKISIVICGKRHHTRFFPTKEEDGDQNGNPKNGTVVDRGVIREREWGFFLQAHHALKGTARACNYAIILDEIGLGADGIEQLVRTNYSLLSFYSLTHVTLLTIG
jgi:eukaryotic translation initiation factor 2C